jgi:quercetin dioxygenase-like cupin family protein
MPDVKRAVSYWHLWTDSEGVSHQERRTVSGFTRRVIEEGTPPIWVSDIEGVPTAVRLGILPVGVIGQWHENPEPQWIVPLSGRWFVEAMDGTRVEMGPGDLSFGGDQGTRERDEKHGHRSGAIGNEPAVLMLVQFAKPAPPES